MQKLDVGFFTWIETTICFDVSIFKYKLHAKKFCKSFVWPNQQLYLQWPAEKPDFLAVYGIKWGHFQWRLHTLKVLFSYFLGYVNKDLGLSSSRGCKTVTCQSWSSKKIVMRCALLFSKKGFEFGPPTLKGHNFAAPKL